MEYTKPIPRNTDGIRDALFDELDLLRAGKSSPQKARTTVMLMQTVIDSIRIQIQYGRMLGEASKSNKAVALGTPKK